MTIEIYLVLGAVVVTGVVLAILEAPPRNPARYSGPVYDPQRPVVRRAGAVGWTGRECPLCKKVTYGDTTRCAACGRMNRSVPMVRTESTSRRSFVESK